jgi:hypothetical protein
MRSRACETAYRPNFLYISGPETGTTDVRFALCRHGEDVTKVLEAFWRERRGDFLAVPLVGYGEAPRSDLCTKQSLKAALATAVIPPGSRSEQLWQEACAQHGVPYPVKAAA